MHFAPAQTNVRDVRKPIIKGHRARCLATGKVFWGNFVATGGGPVQAMPCSTAATILPTAAKTCRFDNRRIDFLNYEPLQKFAYVSYFCLHQAIAPIAMFAITQW
ncbi:MAG TPA: hypothetical protein DHU79_08505 [Clostridiales bacterium]|nr:hypothetical protein [Clostridiales bacterium]